jgi:hypothetical protein
LTRTAGWLAGSGQQGKDFDVLRTDDREISMIERGNALCSEAFRHCDDRSVDHAKVEVAVGDDKPTDASVIRRSQAFDAQLAVGDRGK